jgi:hypothetical protein
VSSPLGHWGEGYSFRRLISQLDLQLPERVPRQSDQSTHNVFSKVSRKEAILLRVHTMQKEARDIFLSQLLCGLQTSSTRLSKASLLTNVKGKALQECKAQQLPAWILNTVSSLLHRQAQKNASSKAEPSTVLGFDKQR